MDTQLKPKRSVTEIPTDSPHIRIVVDVDAAFTAAEQSMNRAMHIMAAGGELEDCVPDLAIFFQAQGEILVAVMQEEPESLWDKGEKRKRKSEEEFISLMRSKKLQKLETELKELLIYTGNGEVYKEMIKRRAVVVEEFQRGQVEQFKQIQLERLARLRHNQKKRQRIEDAIALILGGVVIIGLCAGIFIMIQEAISFYKH